MRASTALFVVLSILTGISSLFAQTWTWENPRPQGNRINEISYRVSGSEGNSGWMVGACGTLLHPSGISSIPVASPIEGWISAVAQTSRTKAWIAGGIPGSIYRTDDYGNNWTPQYLDSSVSVWDICFTDNNNGWAVAYRIDERVFFLLRTTNGGVNWDEQNDARFRNNSLFFLNSQMGWFGSMLRTTDGGVTWLDAPPETPPMSKVWFTDATHGWGIDGHTIEKTTDGGQSWTSQIAPSEMYLTDLCFTDNTRGLIVGLHGIIRTDNGGETWTVAYTDTRGQFCLNAVSITPDGYGYAAGDYGDILFTNDYGTSWHPGSQDVANDAGFSAVSFASHDVGWAVGHQAGQSFILGGRRGMNDYFEWFQETTPWTETFNDVVAIDEQTAYAVGGHGGVFVTTNGGTWLPQYTGTTWDLTKVCFVDRDHGFVLGPSGQEGGEGFILKTSNGGINWISLPFTAEQQTRDMKFVDEMNGWMVGCFADESCGYGIIMHATDGGLTWTQQHHGLPDACYWACDFVSATTGWVVGSPSTILKTTDGGENWTAQECGDAGFLTMVDFADELHGLIVLGGSHYLYTEDGGANWQRRSMSGSQYLSDFTFTDASDGWAVGWDGAILHYENPDNNTAPPDHEVPRQFSLSAYPNPFNPTTTISFSVPNSTRAKISVFDITGRLVRTLSDGLMQAGEHSVVFDGTGLPSGIYFARMEAAGAMQTRKMMLLK